MNLVFDLDCQTLMHLYFGFFLISWQLLFITKLVKRFKDSCQISNITSMQSGPEAHSWFLRHIFYKWVCIKELNYLLPVFPLPFPLLLEFAIFWACENLWIPLIRIFLFSTNIYKFTSKHESTWSWACLFSWQCSPCRVIWMFRIECIQYVFKDAKVTLCGLLAILFNYSIRLRSCRFLATERSNCFGNFKVYCSCLLIL